MNVVPDISLYEIVVPVAFDRAVWRCAMTGWWRSVVPAGLQPWLTNRAQTGAGLMIGVFRHLQRTRMTRFWDETGGHWDAAGETELLFVPNGIGMSDKVFVRIFKSAGVDAVKTVWGSTVRRSGISMIVGSDNRLPGGLSPSGFGARVHGWRAS